MQPSEKMSPLERRAAVGLASIYGLRMLGLFLILPVFAVYASHLPGVVSRTLVGIALGAYGLTQAILQLPFGILSDRYGRKKIIYFGLTLFAIGSFIASTNNIYWIILGRSIQGAGAISAALMALLADLTEESHRTKAFALVGSSIGGTFALSLIAGPLLYRTVGVPGMFLLTGILAIVAMFVIARYVPNPAISRFHSETEVSTARLSAVLRNPQLLRLNYGIFALHSAQMALFVVIPFAIQRTSGIDVSQHWKIYLPVMVVAFILMIPIIIFGEKKNQMKPVFVGAVAALVIAQLILASFINSFHGILAYLVLFYIAFNVLEASLPSLISKIAPVSAKGTAIGVYNTSQSLGIFVGSAVGGYLAQVMGPGAVFTFSGIIIAIWLVLALTMRVPPAARTHMFAIPEMDAHQAAQLTQALSGLQGVLEAIVLPEDKVAYLKVARTGWDEQRARHLMQTGGEEEAV